MCVIVWHGLPDYPKKIELRRVVSFARVVSFYLLFDFSLGVFYDASVGFYRFTPFPHPSFEFSFIKKFVFVLVLTQYVGAATTVL